MAQRASSQANEWLTFAAGIGRAFGGAVLFSFPLLMTMEMWDLGASMDRGRLALFIAASLPLLFGLSYFSGFEKTETRGEDAEDAFVAFAMGFIASALMLSLFGMIHPGMPLREIVASIGLQAVPASIGAIVASKQFHASDGDGEGEDGRESRASYPGELFLMAAGALFVAFNVAPTEEMLVITYVISPWHALTLALISIVMLHAFVYTVGFGGQEERPHYAGFWLTFLHFTIVGYGIALLISLYVLWTFGRIDGVHLPEVATMVVVLGFPASLGAAVARLIV